MTAQDLYDQLRGEVADNPDAKVHVVLYTEDSGSFNVPVSHLSGGGMNNLNIVADASKS